MYFWHNASVSPWKMNMTHNWNALLVNSSWNSFRFRYSVYLLTYLQAKYSCSEEREQFISFYLRLSISFLLSSCFKGWGVSRWLKTHLKIHFQVSCAAFFHMLHFQVQTFLKISTHIWGELNFHSSIIQFSRGFFFVVFVAYTLFSFYPAQRK